MTYATEKFLKTIDNEIKEFREYYASFLFPEAVYKDYYIIFFIESYFNMFFSTADEISEDVICWLNKQKNLAETYKYKPLPPLISVQQRQEYLDALPEGFDVDGNKNCNIYSKSGTLIATGYNRVVIGDYGAFVEFDKTQAIKQNIKVKAGQEYRYNDKQYSENVKYLWLTAKDNSDCKIYFQKKTVNYADYKEGMFYISPYEVKIEVKK